MTIKNNISLIRSLLYFYAVIENGQINATAQKNGIKAANLSKLLKELEEQMGGDLLERTPQGVRPTVLGQKVYTLSQELSEHIEQLLNATSVHEEQEEISLYLPENFELPDIGLFSQQHPLIKISPTKNEKQADVRISYQEIKNTSQIITKNEIGTSFKQTIWISCNKNSDAAISLAEFIITLLHS